MKRSRIAFLATCAYCSFLWAAGAYASTKYINWYSMLLLLYVVTSLILTICLVGFCVINLIVWLEDHI